MLLDGVGIPLDGPDDDFDFPPDDDEDLGIKLPILEPFCPDLSCFSLLALLFLLLIGNVDEWDDGVGEGDPLCLADTSSAVRIHPFSLPPYPPLLWDLVLGGSLGLPESFDGVLLPHVPGSVELELRALADDCRSLVRESRSLLEQVLPVLVVLCFEALLGKLLLVFDLSLELKNLNLSNIEFLLGVAAALWEVLLLEAEELVEVVLPVLTTLPPDLSPVRGCAKFRPPGMGIPEVADEPGEVARSEAEGTGLLLLFLALINDEPEKQNEDIRYSKNNIYQTTNL